MTDAVNMPVSLLSISSSLPRSKLCKHQNQHKTYIYFPKPCSVAWFIPIYNHGIIPTTLDAVSSSSKTEMIYSLTYCTGFFFSKSRNVYMRHRGMPVLFGTVTKVSSSSPGVSHIDWNVRVICSSVQASVIRKMRHLQLASGKCDQTLHRRQGHVTNNR